MACVTADGSAVLGLMLTDCLQPVLTGLKRKYFYQCVCGHSAASIAAIQVFPACLWLCKSHTQEGRSLKYLRDCSFPRNNMCVTDNQQWQKHTSAS